MYFPETVYAFLFLVIYLQYVLCHKFELRERDEGCTLAVPKIEFSNLANFIRLPQTINDNINYGDKVQVGYLQTFRVFQYIGCINTDTIPHGTIKHKVKPDPGQCYSLCRSEYFAIYRTFCYCVTSAISGTSIGCNYECSYPRHTACGGDIDWHTYVSIYKYVQTEGRRRDDGRNCRAYDAFTGTFEWGNCGYQLNGMCTSGTQTDLYLEMTYSSWRNYVQQCMYWSLFPASTAKLSVRQTDEWVVWTGRIKSRVIVKTNESDIEDQHLDYRGYIEKTDYGFTLNFQEGQFFKPNKQLCYKEQSRTIPETLSNINISSRDIKSQTLLQHQNDKRCRTCKTPLLVAYIAIPLCTSICMILLVLYIRLRRRVNVCPKRDNQDNNNDKSEARYSNTAVQNKAYERELPFQSQIDNVSNFVEQEISRDSYTNNTTAFGIDTYTHCVSDGNYDTATSCTANKISNKDVSNVYNTLNEELHVYDHVSDCLPKRHTVSDKEYDHVRKDNGGQNTCNTLHNVVQVVYNRDKTNTKVEQYSSNKYRKGISYIQKFQTI